ncbi:MAG: hypothetical protein L6V86_08575 [Treponema sp.]|nr:MAG: hypothetical protein L6V86_08575 [Treponema sp.]
MKFDESKVFTLLNADKVKIRDKGYFADNLRVLKNAVLTEDRELFGEITEFSLTLLRVGLVSKTTNLVMVNMDCFTWLKSLRKRNSVHIEIWRS